MSHGHSNQSDSHATSLRGAHFDVAAAARRVVMAAGFEPDINAEAKRQLDAIAGPAALGPEVRDLRDRPWSSIDNTESRDLDQIEMAEQLADGNIRLVVGVADVDALVPKGSPLDEHAFANCTSVYTGVEMFPMLPEKLSTDFTSLNESTDRLIIAIETVVSEQGTVVSHDVYRAMARNTAKLAYDEVGAWLDGGAPPKKVSANATLSAQLRLQATASKRLKDERVRNGALEFDTIEASPITQNGRIVDLRVVRKNHARDLIEDFMIASNVAIAKFLEAKGRSGIRRVVREPERWGRIVELAGRYGESLPPEPDSLSLATFLARRRAADRTDFRSSISIVKLMGPRHLRARPAGKDPGGHFGLARMTTHTQRRRTGCYADLVTQRLVKRRWRIRRLRTATTSWRRSPSNAPSVRTPRTKWSAMFGRSSRRCC
jgi:exoribonuclease-2